MKPPHHSITPSAPSTHALADIAVSALEIAAQALRAYSAAVKALESRVALIDVKLESLAAEPLADASGLASWMPAGIELENRSHVDTATAALWLNRKPQTLRGWACFEDGPLRPLRLRGRLMWSVAEIRTALALDQVGRGQGSGARSRPMNARDS
jgi:hypothetical protein